MNSDLPGKVKAQPALDWLRFVLATIVVLSHEGVPIVAPFDAKHAVDVFLALSGWLIGGILLKTSVDGLPHFYFNRATRVWIPYFASMVALYTVAAFKEGVDLYWFKYLFYDSTFTHYTFTVFPQAMLEMPLDGTGNNYWSLSVEEQFYLILPLGLLLGRKFNGLLSWLAAIFFMVLIGGRFLPIAFGTLAATMQWRWGDWHLSRTARALLVLCAAASGYTLHFHESSLGSAIFSISVVLALSYPGVRGPVGLFFGAISFPLYLNAWMGVFAGNLLSKILRLPEAVHLPLNLGLAMLAAIATWWSVDRLVMKYRAQYYTTALGKKLAVTAYLLVGIGLIGGTLILMCGG